MGAKIIKNGERIKGLESLEGIKVWKGANVLCTPEIIGMSQLVGRILNAIYCQEFHG